MHLAYRSLELETCWQAKEKNKKNDALFSILFRTYEAWVKIVKPQEPFALSFCSAHKNPSRDSGKGSFARWQNLIG